MNLRTEILSTLRENIGEWVSGETLSEKLNVSRTTIWKELKKLQTAGYQIESSTKKGYRFIAAPDIVSPEEVLPGLGTARFGKEHYLYFTEIDSTNNYARKLAAENYPEGTVVVADKQSAGRGRRGRSWYSPEGEGLYLSLILRPRIPLQDLSRLSMVAAAALATTLEEEFGLEPQIKWPNDILINGRKVAGILTEAVTDMDGIEYIVTGIGINVNNEVEEFPDDFRTPATSLRKELGQTCSRVVLVQGLLYYLEREYRRVVSGDFSPILDKVRKISSVIGKRVRLDDLNGVLVGKAIDIDHNGFLWVLDEKGVTHTVMSGEIFLLPPA
ncbi:MAG: biotin--[acetyl-CoA-carboxylase] ligase [Syntrophomonadaceae bacterium]|nr:biotin--[acetyl-CoA-carboxylase] ligase [Syntrophomonadaceae bacterium]